MSSAKRFAAGRIRPGSRGHSARSNAALRLLLLLVGLTVTVACGGSAPSLHFQRATVDRPDELEGPQIHFVYAVPAGRKELDRDWDENGALVYSIDTMRTWFLRQKGASSLRIDTYRAKRTSPTSGCPGATSCTSGKAR